MMATAAVGWSLLAALLLMPSATFALEDCQYVEGQHVIAENCRWQQQAATESGDVVLEGPPAGVGSTPPMLLVNSAGAVVPPKVTTGFALTLKRVMLENVALAPPTAAGGLPVLLPLGMFSTAPSTLRMVDVRLMVPQDIFGSYLAFFSKELDATQLTAEGGSITMYTDGKSFIFIPAWSNSNTELLSVSIASGPCLRPDAVSQRGNPWRPAPGCNIVAADNMTLIPTLQRNASVATAAPLLIRITSNVTLGPNLKGSLSIRRPVILLGLASSLTSVDLGMVVNQLNVTPPMGTLLWQGLVLENLAPGDSLSSSIAAPYSTTTSTNMWPIYCNRSAALCVRMNNVTMVIPTEREVNYHIFMYTMYSSTAETLRQLASFMRTDLGFKQLEFGAGPGNDTMTIKRLLSRSWQFKNVITTAQTFVAPKMPPPPRPFVLAKSGPAPLVTAIKDCSTFKAAVNYNSTRVFVWRLLRNVSIGEGGKRTCDFPSGYIAAQTHLFGQVLPDNRRQPTSDDDSAVEVATASAGPDAAAAGSDGAATPPGDDVYSLSFGYVSSAFKLPQDAQDKFMQIQNVTLKQLPQLLQDETRLGRLLRQLPGSSTPPGVWTILLWPWHRSASGTPLFVADSQLMLPEPEWSLLAQVARGDDSFALQLQGPVGLTFTGVTVVDELDMIRVGSLQGPGITGSNLWLFKDPTPAASIPGYSWPASLAAAAVQSTGSYAWQQQQQGLSTAAQAAIGVCLAVFGVVAIALGALLLVRHRRRQVGMLLKSQLPSTGSFGTGRLSTDACDSESGDGKPGSRHSYVSPLDAASVNDVSRVRPGSAGKVGMAISAATAAKLAARSSAARGSAASSDSTAAAASDCLTNSKAGAGDGDHQSGSAGSSVEQSIAQGLQRWSAAVSATTMQLMKRRLELNNASALFPGGSGASSSHSACIPSAPLVHSPQGAGPAGVGLGISSVPGTGPSRTGSDGGPALQLQHVIGTGSFGSVYLANWRGKQVAVKVMHLPADALMEPLDQQPSIEEDEEDSSADGSAASTQGELRLQQQQHRRRQQWQRQQNSPPHMAIMEAVVSSTMCHPNVVQVYTYMLTPLMARQDMQQSGQQQQQQLLHKQLCVSEVGQQLQQEQWEGSGKGDKGLVSGWSMRLVMEYCDQGTLREALDRKRLPRLPGTTFLQPLVVLTLAHDIAAALLHLHSEGIVHGDLKAGNVLLTAASITNAGQHCCCDEHDEQSAAEVWAQAGSLPLIAKVADFGLAMPLGPTDTHATMLARGTPTHMAPEVFMLGHVSKGSDVYAFGILLYEIITGRRAYASVPIPLLPHEVAMRGLRPEWPRDLPSRCAAVQRLAEACWVQDPQNRPSFVDILQALEQSCMPPASETTAAGPSSADAVSVPSTGAPSAGNAGAAPDARMQVMQGEMQQQAQQPQLVQLHVQVQPQQQQQQQQQACIQLPAGLQHPAVGGQAAEWVQPKPQQVQLSPGRASGAGGEGALDSEPFNRNAMGWSEVSYGNNDSNC